MYSFNAAIQQVQFISRLLRSELSGTSVTRTVVAFTYRCICGRAHDWYLRVHIGSVCGIHLYYIVVKATHKIHVLNAIITMSLYMITVVGEFKLYIYNYEAIYLSSIHIYYNDYIQSQNELYCMYMTYITTLLQLQEVVKKMLNMYHCPIKDSPGDKLFASKQVQMG